MFAVHIIIKEGAEILNLESFLSSNVHESSMIQITQMYDVEIVRNCDLKDNS